MRTPGAPPVTIRTLATFLVSGGLTAAALMVLLGFLLPFLVVDPPYGFGIHPFVESNPGPSWQHDGTYGRVVAGLFAWLGGAAVGIRTAGLRRPREQALAAASLVGVVAILVLADALLAAAVRAGAFQPRPPARAEPAQVSQRTPLPSCGEDKLLPNGDPVMVEAHRCLLEAFVAGETAELVVVDFPSPGNRTDQIIRVLADGTVEVFVHTGDDFTTTRGWARRTCAAVGPGVAPRVFELVDCSPLVEIS